MVVPLGCQVVPVFARNYYTGIFRASIENPKGHGKNTEDVEDDSRETLLLPHSESLPG